MVGCGDVVGSGDSGVLNVIGLRRVLILTFQPVQLEYSITKI